jgi:ribonuclease G
MRGRIRKLAGLKDILINGSPQETRVAIVEHGALQELHVERTLERGLVGNIYLGKVTRVMPGMQSAFIDIGLEKAAFLHVADVWQAHEQGASKEQQPAIEKLIFDGQSLMVQVIKDPLGTKGARLSTQVSLAGRLLVFLPQDNHIGVSQKIAGELRDSLKSRLSALAGEQGGGFILRTNAEDASDEELAADMAYLRKAWAHVREQSQRLPAKSALYRELSLVQRTLRDIVDEQTQMVRLDSREQLAQLQAFAAQYMPQLATKIHHYAGEAPIFDLFGIDDDIAMALGRRVKLKSGGYVVIDQTEALTSVDVNTGGFVGARNFEDTIFKTNLEAAQTIARQLRLRNLGGIIVVDFIDMHRAEHRDAVLAELRKQLARDRVKTSVSNFSALGLVEMTRARTRESLAHQLCEPCPACEGKGEVKTPRTVAYEILREILRESRQFSAKEFRVIAAPQVVELFLDEESQHLAGLIDFIGRPVSLQADATMNQERYDIVLM